MSCDWLFIDGSSLIFRAYYGVPKTVTSPDGRLINAARGFFETLTRMLGTRDPLHIAVASDADWRPDWRVQLIPGYKAQRVAEPIPPGLIPQMPVIDDFLAAIGIDTRRCARLRGGGRDRNLDREGRWERSRSSAATEICSRSSRTRGSKVLYPEKGAWGIVDEAEVTRRYGIPGRRYADFAMLRGDPSDGLPGLKGVGAVAAASMIRQHGGVAALLEARRLSEPTTST